MLLDRKGGRGRGLSFLQKDHNDLLVVYNKSRSISYFIFFKSKFFFLILKFGRIIWLLEIRWTFSSSRCASHVTSQGDIHLLKIHNCNAGEGTIKSSNQSDHHLRICTVQNPLLEVLTLEIIWILPVMVLRHIYTSQKWSFLQTSCGV